MGKAMITLFSQSYDKILTMFLLLAFVHAVSGD